MVNEDPFSNIDIPSASPVVGKKLDEGTGLTLPNPSSSHNQILKRVFHTRTEMMIYPNGQVYPGKTQSWFESTVYTHKPKEKKKKIMAKESQLNQEESY